jgi:hypothetical protein
MKTPFEKGSALFLTFLLFSLLTGVSGQPNQTIYTQYCVARPDTSCFQPVNNAVDSVGRDVSAIGGNFRFCLELDTVDTGYAPIRVILLLDRSGSMCDNSGPCCVDGDSSGLCMYNDPTNQRILAAHNFVDSLRARSPESEVGIVDYGSNTREHNPRSLMNDADVTQIHDWIDDAACTPPRNLGKVAKTTQTYLGAALEVGLDLVDNNYNSMSPGMPRHIILLTDGGWDDVGTRPPDEIISNYINSFPNRAVPTVHGVFLSDTALHVAHGYPPQGCSGTRDVDLAHLSTVTQLTSGQYFPASTPQTVVDNFRTLLDSVSNTVPQRLVDLVVLNSTTGASSSSTNITHIGSGAVWESRISDLPLVFGENKLVVTQKIFSPSAMDTITKTTAVTIVRSTLYREALDTDLFKEYCENGSARLTIKASPDTNLQNEPFDVVARISNMQNFNLDTTQLRIFTRFPDNENGVLATFHLDGNLDNATGGTAGTGNPTFTSSTQLFGSGGITGGNFSYTLPQLGGEFSLEAWVNPGANRAAVLFSGSGNRYEVGVDSNMKLYFKTETSVIATAINPLDEGVWSHIAVARKGGNLQLFINGIAVSEPVAFATALTAGVVSTSAPNLWTVDEVRFSNVSRVTTQGGNTTIAIPALANTAWLIAGVPSTSEALTVAQTAWTNGQLDLQFPSPVEGQLLVNIRRKNAGSVSSGWSKNSNPVTVASDRTGPYVKRAILTPASLDETYDTLLIEFTEPANCAELKRGNAPDQVFDIFSTRENPPRNPLQGSAFTVTSCDEAYVNSVTITVPAQNIVPGTDSLLLTRATVTDQSGNPAETDEKGPIVWGDGNQIEIITIPTVPGQGLKIDPQIVTKLNLTVTNGQIVQVRVRRELKALAFDAEKRDSTYGLANVYDPVGNLVRIDLPVFRSKENPLVYYLVWNGLNRTDRRVGSGAYLIIFKFRYTDNSELIKKQKIALQW